MTLALRGRCIADSLLSGSRRLEVLVAEEVHEAEVVPLRHAEQRHQALVAAAGLAQAARDELADLAAAELALEVRPVHELPEAAAALGHPIEQLGALVDQRHPLELAEAGHLLQRL